MSHFDNEPFFEGDWEDRGDLIWNEFDWEQYLREQDHAVQKYRGLYEKHRTRPDRLDHIASLMNWDNDEWTAEENPESFREEEVELAEISRQDLEEEDSWEPYTLHRHPVYIANRALIGHLQDEWDTLLSSNGESIPVRLATNFVLSLHRADHNATFAVQALDYGDYALCTAQMKRALAELNATFLYLEEIRKAASYQTAVYHREALVRLFDLREIWLRVMQFCREEVRRQPEDED